MSKGTQGKFNAAYVYECGMRAGLREASQNQHIARSEGNARSDRYSRAGVAGAYANAIASRMKRNCKAGSKAWEKANAMRKAALKNNILGVSVSWPMQGISRVVSPH